MTSGPLLAATAPELGSFGPIAVIDIGSNSIRLVVFAGATRSAATLFNEKVLCGLGRGLAKSGRLHPEGMVMARANLLRFTRLARAMGVAQIDLLATAAVREADNGPDFVRDVERLCGLPVIVLSGAEEARLSALGVVAGLSEADGVMGDLGGGSLELVELNRGRVGRSATLALGPLLLTASCGGEAAALDREIDRQLDSVDWLRTAAAGADFYPVGGAWRNLARIHMERSGYPLLVIHGYTMRQRQVDDLCRMLSGRSLGGRGDDALPRSRAVIRRRLETLPVAATILSRVLRAVQAETVVFSALGLREGHLFSLMPDREQALDPVLSAAGEVARREARFDDLGDALSAWTDPLFAEEDSTTRRLRRAACLLSDIAWREHPDYRAVQAWLRILHLPFVGASHGDRVFLAYTVYSRYGGRSRAKEVARYLSLIAPETAARARILGLAQRLAYTLSGATRAVLLRSALHYQGRDLVLSLPKDGSAPDGEVVKRRFAALAKALGAAHRRIDA